MLNDAVGWVDPGLTTLLNPMIHSYPAILVVEVWVMVHTCPTLEQATPVVDPARDTVHPTVPTVNSAGIVSTIFPFAAALGKVLTLVNLTLSAHVALI